MPATLESVDTALAGDIVERLPTPCVLVDVDRLDRNLAGFQERIAQAGVALRPHAKTHKAPAIADRQLALGAAGLAVAKPSEARVFVEHGVADIDIAYPVAGSRSVDSVVRLARPAPLPGPPRRPPPLRALPAA